MVAALSPLPVAWEDLARAFHLEGTDRDIVLPGANLERWTLVMRWLEELERSGVAHVERTPKRLPKLAAFLPETEEMTPPARIRKWPMEPRITVVLHGLRIDCPFYEQASIEFQVDPNQIQSADDAAQLLGFVRTLAKTAQLSAYLTEDNMHDMRWLAFHPVDDRWEWTPLSEL